jgi:hypothetical protein
MHDGPDHVLVRAVVAVELPGIEPGSSAALTGLLRAQLTVSLLGPTVHVSKTVRRAQSRLVSPRRPRDRIWLASPLNDAGYWAEGMLRPTEPLLASGGESELSAIILGAYSFQRRLTRRRWLPRLASPAATYRVETCQPRDCELSQASPSRATIPF